MKKVFLEDLPRKIYRGKECIDWKNSIGYKVEFIYDDVEGELEILNYIPNNNPRISIKYNNEIFDIQTNNFKKCKIGNIIGVKTSEFKIKIGTIFKDNKRDLVIVDRVFRRYKSESNKQNLKYYEYKCNKCGADLWIEESSLLRGIGCSCCNGKTVVKGINDIATTNTWMLKYFVDKEDAYTHTYASNNKVLCKCPNCGTEKEMSINKLYNRNFSCPQCSDGISYPEKIMFNLLKQLKSNNQLNNFIYQYTSKNNKWCNTYKYDFYFELNNEQYIIETHGGQHYNYSFESCDGKSVEDTQQNDKNKKELAIQNGIKKENYIVIDCRKSELDFIKNNILNSRLNKIFDLSNIDWIKIGQYSEKSLVKEVCDYWNNKNYLENTLNLANIFNISRSTIINYLKKGKELGWCNYNPKEENKKITDGMVEFYKKSMKKIEVFKNDISLGVFESITYVEKHSMELFGVQVSNKHISSVCKGKRKTHKGLSFKYV